jgi:CRISPR/Cas system-associated exonuclease Cas4 (RecB family)
MSLYVSASMIADFIECPQKVYYRLNFPESSIKTSSMIIGGIVHETLHNFWNNKKDALEYVGKSILKYPLTPATTFDSVYKCVESYFRNFQLLCSSEDLPEYSFKLEIDKDVYLVGKIDRILKSGTIIDWKTSPFVKKDIATSIQFIVYSEVFTKLFQKPPLKTYLASLSTGTLIEFEQQKPLTNLVFSSIIPAVIRTIKRQDYTRTGVFRNLCRNCSYREACHKEFGYVMDCSIPNKE